MFVKISYFFHFFSSYEAFFSAKRYGPRHGRLKLFFIIRRDWTRRLPWFQHERPDALFCTYLPVKWPSIYNAPPPLRGPHRSEKVTRVPQERKSFESSRLVVKRPKYRAATSEFLVCFRVCAMFSSFSSCVRFFSRFLPFFVHSRSIGDSVFLATAD